MKTFLLAALCTYMPISYAQAIDADDVEARIHMEKFLDDHDPFLKLDSARHYSGWKSYFLLEAVKNDSVHVSVYKLSWACSHLCPDYIMVIDFEKRHYRVYGQHETLSELRELSHYFFQHPFFKVETVCRVMNF